MIHGYYNDLTSFAGISWYHQGMDRYTSDITLHPVTMGVSTAYFPLPESSLIVGYPAVDLIRDGIGYVMVAASRVGSGKVIGLATEDSVVDWRISFVDNLRLAENMIDWAVMPSTGQDAAVTGLPVSSNAVYPGWLVGINVTVANLGDETITFTVSLLYNNNVIAAQLVQNLVPNATSALSFAWDTTNVPVDYNYTISAEIPPLPTETNLTNNKLTVEPVQIKILGDVNGDCRVSLADLVLIAQAYGSEVGDYNYNPAADFKNRGAVSLVDLVTCANHYGQSYIAP